MKFWTTAAPNLAHPPFFSARGCLTAFDEQSRSIAAGAFGKVIQRLDITVPACAIMNDHVHIVFLRSKYRIEYLVNQLKGTVTIALKVRYTPWTRGYWKVFIDDRDAFLAAIRYVQANPTSAGLPPQSWDFISPLLV
jgi:REP element-mobilizing transposase RayT